jgi:hypothetical protein
LSAIGLCWLDSASVFGSVTVQPWNRKSPVFSSMNTAGQWLVSVSGSIAMKRSAMARPPWLALRLFAHVFRLWGRPHARWSASP